MFDYLDVPVIIPSLEPDDRLPTLLGEMRQAGIRRILLVDDGSSQSYRHYFDEAEEQGCTVLRHAVNLGKGRALKTAFNHCLNVWPDAPGAITADSDGQHSVPDILRFMQEMCAHPDSLLLGCRDFDDAGVPFKSRYGNKITCFMFRSLCGVSVSDTQTGLRGVPTTFMRRLMNVAGERFEFESNMLIETKDRLPLRAALRLARNFVTLYIIKSSDEVFYLLSAVFLPLLTDFVSISELSVSSATRLTSFDGLPKTTALICLSASVYSPAGLNTGDTSSPHAS